jgi:hypothetical protein
MFIYSHFGTWSKFAINRNTIIITKSIDLNDLNNLISSDHQLTVIQHINDDYYMYNLEYTDADDEFIYNIDQVHEINGRMFLDDSRGYSVLFIKVSQDMSDLRMNNGLPENVLWTSIDEYVLPPDI